MTARTVLQSLFLAAFASALIGCATTSKIETAPGATVWVDGKEIGVATAEGITAEIPAGSKPVVVKVQQADKQNERRFEREADVGAIAAGTGLGVCGCLAISAFSFATGLICPPLLAGVFVGPVAVPAVGVAAWYAYKRAPDKMTVPVVSGEGPLQTVRATETEENQSAIVYAY